MVKFIHLFSKEEENNKCHLKVRILKGFLSFYKTIKESISSHVLDGFYSKNTQRDTGHPKGTLRALQWHSGTQGTLAFEHLRYSGARSAPRRSQTQSTWALSYSIGTHALRHLGIWALETHYLADSARFYCISWRCQFFFK